MPNYRYTAIRDDGSLVAGEAFAATPEELEFHLAQRGLFLTQLHRKVRLRTSAGIPSEQFLLFLKQFSALLRAGQPAPEAIRLAREANNGPVARLLEQVLANVNVGDRLSDAFAKSGSLDPMFIGLLRTGEQSGEITRSIESYESLLERRMVLGRKIKQALLYPLFVLFMLGIIIVVLFTFSLPRFVDMYAGLNAQLPAATQMLISLSTWVLHYGALAVVGTVAIGLLVKHLLSKPITRERVHGLLLRAPFVGLPLRYYSLAVFNRSFATLLGSGVGLVESLRQVAEVVPNAHFAKGVRRLAENIFTGSTLTQALREADFLPPTVRNLLMVGDQASDAASRLTELAGYFENLLDYRLSTLLSLLEPFLVLVTGLIVGTIVIIMYLPVFSLAGAIG